MKELIKPLINIIMNKTDMILTLMKLLIVY